MEMAQKHTEQYKMIGQAIKKYRKQKGHTQQQLADTIGRLRVSVTKQ